MTKFLRYFLIILPYIILVYLLFLARSFGYLFFHTTAGFAVVLVAGGVFMLVWNARKFIKNSYFRFLGIIYFFVGIFAFFQTLTYKGMAIFQGLDANIPTQFWLAERSLLVFSLLISPIFLKRKLNDAVVFFIYLLATVFLFLTIFYWRIFPVSYIEGSGPTIFKIISEYFLSLSFLLVIIVIWNSKHYFDKNVFRFLLLSLIFNFLTEVSFLFYSDVYDTIDIIGHVSELISYLFIYKAIIEIGLSQPYNLLFLELQKESKRKDEFLSIVSHELKTPLTNIKLYAQILSRKLSTIKDSSISLFGQKINAQTDKITSLINDLLDIGKIETGKLNYHFSKFDYTELVNQTIADLQNVSEDHDLVIKNKGKHIITGDRDRISQVLVNLLSNAIKYSSNKGKIIIEIKKDKNSIITSVQDFGIGIPHINQPYVFDKYYQVGGESGTNKGMGLGLYITKEIVKKHKGNIWLESLEGKGSTFYFSLPIS